MPEQNVGSWSETEAMRRALCKALAIRPDTTWEDAIENARNAGIVRDAEYRSHDRISDENTRLSAQVAAVRALADEWDAANEPAGETLRAALDDPAKAPADPHLSEWQTQMRGFLGKRVEIVLNEDPRKVVVGVLHHFDTDGQVYVEDEDGSWGWAWPCLDIAEAAGSVSPREDETPEPAATGRSDVYVRMAESRIVKTFEPAYGVAIDVDTNGDVVGVELIGALGVEIDGAPAGVTTPAPDPQPVNTDLLDLMRSGVTSREHHEAPCVACEHVSFWHAPSCGMSGCECEEFAVAEGETPEPAPTTIDAIAWYCTECGELRAAANQPTTTICTNCGGSEIVGQGIGRSRRATVSAVEHEDNHRDASVPGCAWCAEAHGIEADDEVWIPPATDCMEYRADFPCPHCGGEPYHHRTGRCGKCGRRRPAPWLAGNSEATS